MTTARTTHCLLAAILFAPALVLLPNVGNAKELPSPVAEQARAILEATGVQGGLVVHLRCGDGKLTAALRASDSYLVHGLDGDAANVAKAREHIRSLDLYGKVSVEQWGGKYLPYAENMVNLLVLPNGPGNVPMAEIMRVLAPRGVAYVKQRGNWTKTVKPWPEEIDEWRHHMHGPDANPVSRDRVIGPPRRLQWLNGPTWARRHSVPPSLQSMVSTGGRVFAFRDTAPEGVSLPERWNLVAGGKLLVGSLDTHAVTALEETTGKQLWAYVADGPIDTPPTVYGDLALFGCRDGRVYCLRASDGALVWRFLAAPHERRVMVRSRLESAWPVHGTVLIRDGVAYVVAGRSSVLDGGLYVYALDPATGKIRKQSRFETPEAEFQRPRNKVPGNRRAFQGENATLADILVTDGSDIYVHHMKLDTSTEPCLTHNRAERSEAGPGKVGFEATEHFIASGGFLDETMYNRSHWALGQKARSQLLVFGDKTAYGTYGVQPGYNQWGSFSPLRTYTLFAADRSTDEQRWTVQLPMRVQAMTLSRDTLFAAGTPNGVDKEDPWAAVEGRRGGVLLAIARRTGDTLAECDLTGAPAWDGMAAADGRLYISLKNGKVVCYEKDDDRPAKNGKKK